MDLTKVLLSGIKFFLTSLLGVLIAALTVAMTGYQPGNPLEIVLFTYMAGPIISGLLGALQNWRKHLESK